jgi:AraC-like DNA-binding protein
MNQFFLRQGLSKEIQSFSHIIEFAFKKNNTVHLNSFCQTISDHVRIYFVTEGKFEWIIDKQNYILFPGDLAIILPGQVFGSENGYLDIGSLNWMHINVTLFQNDGTKTLGTWSSLSESENLSIRKVLLLNKIPVVAKFRKAAAIFQSLQTELFYKELGYHTRINQLIDELFISITRQLTRQSISQRDFPQTFMKLEQTLRQNLPHQWSVEEMAALVGLGTTAFSEKVKSYTGFSPLNYLINIRISEAIKLLKKQEENLTDIALDTGFYSSQHFSTTFKKLTGYTPSQFRKNYISKNHPE